MSFFPLLIIAFFAFGIWEELNDISKSIRDVRNSLIGEFGLGIVEENQHDHTQ